MSHASCQCALQIAPIWLTIDTHAGDTVPVALTAAYAAPEVAIAHQQRQKTVQASAAVDIWAVGVMAYELLTRSIWFAGMSQDQILAAVATAGQLPWEASTPDARRALRKSLRALAPHVMSCLSRDPMQRPSAAELVAKLDSLYQTTTSKISDVPQVCTLFCVCLILLTKVSRHGLLKVMSRHRHSAPRFDETG